MGGLYNRQRAAESDSVGKIEKGKKRGRRVGVGGYEWGHPHLKGRGIYKWKDEQEKKKEWAESMEGRG